ncbi:MAG: site-specific DNA-methyltransferase [Candidatus Nanoarchaeia archaeon]|nr:site-specific DNA-methyltransferase [Candidatus Nanoarchaeia archaeon]
MGKNMEQCEYFETQNGVLYCADNLDILSYLPEKIKLCFTSPPYNIGQQQSRRSDFYYGGDRKNYQQVYDRHNDNKDEKEYIKTQRYILELMWDMLLDDGAIFYNHKPRIVNGVFDDRKNLIPICATLRQEIIWYKGGQINHQGSFFVSNTERIFILAKDQWKPNREFIKLGEVWDIPSCGCQKEKIEHPVDFPLKLAKTVIASASQEGDLILDPYSGSGTVAVACEQLNRRWICCEISEKYCSEAKQRILKESNQLKMF